MDLERAQYFLREGRDVKELFGEEVHKPREHVALDPEGNNVKRFEGFYLKVEARMWP